MTTATMTDQRYLGYRAAAKYCGLSEQTLRRLVDAGRLRVYRPTGGRLVVFDARELDSFIQGSAATEANGST